MFFSPCNWVKNLLSFPGPAQVVYNNLGMKGPGAATFSTWCQCGWVGNDFSKALLPLRKNSPKECQNGGLKDYICSICMYLYILYIYRNSAHVIMYVYFYIYTCTRVFMYILRVKVAMKSSRQDGSTSLRQHIQHVEPLLQLLNRPWAHLFGK